MHDLVIHNNQFSKGNLLSLAYWINRKYNAKFRVRISAFATKIVDLKCMPFAMHVGVTYLWKTLDLTINIVQPLRKKKHLYFSCQNYLSQLKTARYEFVPASQVPAGFLQQKKHKFGAGFKGNLLNRKKGGDDSDDSSEEEAPKKKKSKKKHESSSSDEEEKKEEEEKRKKKEEKKKKKEKEKEAAKTVDVSSNCLNIE